MKTEGGGGFGRKPLEEKESESKGRVLLLGCVSIALGHQAVCTLQMPCAVQSYLFTRSTSFLTVRETDLTADPITGACL